MTLATDTRRPEDVAAGSGHADARRNFAALLLALTSSRALLPSARPEVERFVTTTGPNEGEPTALAPRLCDLDRIASHSDDPDQYRRVLLSTWGLTIFDDATVGPAPYSQMVTAVLEAQDAGTVGSREAASLLRHFDVVDHGRELDPAVMAARIAHQLALRCTDAQLLQLEAQLELEVDLEQWADGRGPGVAEAARFVARAAEATAPGAGTSADREVHRPALELPPARATTTSTVDLARTLAVLPAAAREAIEVLGATLDPAVAAPPLPVRLAAATTLAQLLSRDAPA